MMAKKEKTKKKAKKKDKSKKKKSGGDGGAQQFLMANGEKVGLGLVGVIVVVCLVAAIGKETVSESFAPKRLESKAKAALRVVEEKEPEPAPPSIYKSILTMSKGIKAEGFALAEMVSVPPGDLKGKRQEPVYLPPEDLHVVAGSGYIAFIGDADPDGGGKLEGDAGFEAIPGNVSVVKHYMVITGLVPRKKQRIEFEKAFRETLGSDPGDDDNDSYEPDYYRMTVERAEVAPGQSEDQLTWSIINEKSSKDLNKDVRDRLLDKLIMQEWADVLPESLDVLPPEFTEYFLVYVNVYKNYENWLPPLMLRNWTAGEVVHPGILKALEDANAAPPKDLEDDERGGRRDDSDDEGPGELDEEALIVAADEYGFRMLRHFDFDVEPGKQYRYRVSMVVSNPNDGFEDRFLSQEALDKKDESMKADGNNIFRETPTSVASKPVGLPSDLSVELISVVAKTRVGEPTAQFEITALGDVQAALAQAEKNLAKIRNSIRRREAAAALKALASQWNDVDRVWATGNFSVYRGAWLNLDGNDSVQVTNPLTRAQMPLPGFPFTSGHLLVDIRGGRAMDGKKQPAFTVPGETLLLDPEGKLIIRYEAGQGGGESSGGSAAGGKSGRGPAEDPSRFNGVLDETE